MNNMQKLESFDSGSNYRFGDKMMFTNQPRSKFDLTHRNTLTIPNGGMVFPIDWFETNPNEDFDISVDCLLRVLPQVVPLYSRQRLYVYGFYQRYSDMWDRWQVHARKGYSGNVVVNRPQLSEDNLVFTENQKVAADSLADYLDLPIGASAAALSEAGLQAMPAFMYLRIWRDYFMNKDHFINDRILLPDDDSRFRLNDDGELLSAKDVGKSLKFDLFGPWNDITYDNDGNLIVGGFYHDYPSDRFNSAKPFLQRGNTPSVNINVTDVNLQTSLTPVGVSINNLFGDTSNTVDSPSYAVGFSPYNGFGVVRTRSGDYQSFNSLSIANFVGDDILSGQIGLGSENHNGAIVTEPNGINLNTFLNSKISVTQPTATTTLTGTLATSLTTEALRKLLIEQGELEKMAMTDGSYGQFGLTFFGERSKAAYDFKPLYIGGTYKNIAFTEVLQTSVGNSDVNTPLGSYAGHGITGITQGRIGRVHSDDFGIIMLLACIMPDVYYHQGLDKKWTKSTQAELYLPERARLGLQPILNKELVYQGDNSSAEGKDNYLWAYNNAYDEFRYSPNKIHGKIADSSNESFFPYTQARHFNTLPNWGREFSEANDVSKRYLSAPSEDAYSADFYINIRAVRPIPYKPVPAEIIN